MNFRQTTKASLTTIGTVATTISNAATYVDKQIQHELTKQGNLHAQELDQGLYLKQAQAEQLVELKQLLDSLPEDIAAQLTK